ncbi:MAG: tRNA dihydrouridine(20/20a) synthase DusA, partial [Rhodobacteraceae bacterium]|nr:tRNA dihydrouridine(20/20a) synthase DusA [Paracoccaceae bacterium]
MIQNSHTGRSAPLSIAPMMEWTDRHCRFMHRLLSRRALLYTEMVAAAAVVRGPRERLLAFSPEEHPVALQLGGSDPAELAEAVRIAADWGYDEINLNVGCPSDRVQNGAFGACLMRDPEVVARCCAAMIAASEAAEGPEITVKCRIGVDDDDPAVRLPQFLDIVSSAGVSRFAVHARKAWLKGLSPKENRSVPPLDYALVRAMKQLSPALDLSLNGGLSDLAQAEAERTAGEGPPLDGVMIGRAAYHDPVAILGAADRLIYGEN